MDAVGGSHRGRRGGKAGSALKHGGGTAAKRAWPLYQDHKCSAYVCQAGRFFRQIKYIAFYAERCIQREIPRIRARYDNVVWSTEESHRLLGSDDKCERKLGKVMRCGLENGWDQGVYQVFLLSRVGDPKHVSLKSPLENGREVPFVRKQRYTSVDRLRSASSVWDL